MKFIIENVSKSSGRLGQLIIGEKERSFRTPLLLQTTRSGSIPHLSRDAFDRITKDVQVLQLSLSTILRMVESIGHFNDKMSLSSYFGYKNYPNVLLLRDPCERLTSGHNEKNAVPLFTRHGKELLTEKRFMDIIETLTPDIYEGLCDADTNFESSKKRVQKSLDRTEHFMKYCYERQKSSEKLKASSIFAPIVGGYSPQARSRSIKHTKQAGTDSFGGYILEGFHGNGNTAMNINETEFLKIVTHCLGEMDAEKPRLIPGAYTPPIVLELVRLGIDMFDTSYVYWATLNYKALIFDFDLNPTLTKATTAKEYHKPYLDLGDERFKDDFQPIMAGCACLTCSNHTRAYVQHLYNTRELLGPILLMIHNTHHYMEFFKAIHQSIISDNLAELLQLIKYGNNSRELLDYRLDEPNKSSLNSANICMKTNMNVNANDKESADLSVI